MSFLVPRTRHEYLRAKVAQRRYVLAVGHVAATERVDWRGLNLEDRPEAPYSANIHWGSAMNQQWHVIKRRGHTLLCHDGIVLMMLDLKMLDVGASPT